MADLEVKEEVRGAFMESLLRNNAKIKKDRAIAISEDAYLIYKREVEDMIVAKKRLERERENMLDMSPETATSLKLASDFDAKAFVAKDIEIGVRLREMDIKLEIAKTQFQRLFGEAI